MSTATPAGLQAAATEAYKRNPYPAMIHVRNNPDRYAVMARLTGMDPPDIRTARVLEVGAGNGLNQLALAQAFPDAHFTAFDIEADAIEQGEAMRQAAGIENARLEVFDLLDAEGRIDGEYDYIVAHGVFAWVPPPVAEALIALIGRHLSPQGVAMVSFNALPGCYVRLAIRDMMLRAVVGATTPEERLDRARAALAAVAEPREDDSVVQRGFRDAAQVALKGDARVLIHDELGAEYHPQRLPDVLAQARRHGLAFLGDTTIDRMRQSFVNEGDEGADLQHRVEERACAIDEAEFCMFRRLLLIREEAAPPRVVKQAAVETLYAGSIADEPEPGVFVHRGDRVEIANEGLAAVVRRLMAAHPARVPVRDLALAPDMVEPLLALYDHNIVNLHTVDAPWAVVPGEHPRTSPLARVMLAQGIPSVATLAHFPLQLEPSVAEAVMALDGESENGRFDAIVAEAGVPREVALANLAGLSLLMPER